ncbi:MAG TPA: hypothetical protein VER26_19950 [Xanthobacteraceae bacterium]|jgi:hypothetical protein|nr:hypothetical protein [Xanthobacteraceae bacterium]
MDNTVTSQAEGDEQILTFDISDDALERAACAEQTVVTAVYCTYDWCNSSPQ